MKKNKLTVIGITIGDYAGIGPEVTVKALGRRKLLGSAKVVIYGNRIALDDISKRIKKTLPYQLIDEHEDITFRRGRIFLLDCSKFKRRKIFYGKIDKKIAADSMQYIKKAAEDALAGRIDAIVTAPINKSGIQKAGFRFAGHTDYLASLCKVKHYAMMFVGAGMKVVLATIHIPLNEVSKRISKNAIHQKILLADRALKKWFGIKKPKIGVCGLNPHAGEGGVLGDEERRFIIPAIRRAASEGMDVSGPFPSDTLFNRCRKGEFDVVLAMYHDQGLIPIKLLAFNRGVNVTLGLPFIRTSPDHGTAYDIAGNGSAEAGSMTEALRLAVQLSSKHRRAR